MSPQKKPIDQQVIVVTGASSGIGLATAMRAAEQRAHVVLAARSEKTLAHVCAQLVADGLDASYVVADVASRRDVESIAAHTISRYGRIDTWVNNAGVSIYGRLDAVTEQDSRRLFDINFWGVVHGSLVALPHLVRSGGTLINLGSEVSEAVIPLQGMYSASKHAVKGFTDALRVEVEEVDKAPVTITLVQPTAVDTPYPQHAKNYMDKEPKLPSPRIDPQRVAEAILKAASAPKRAVKVGAMATVNTLMAKVAPAIGEKMSAKQFERQQYDEPPRDPQGTLDRPGEAGRIRGTGPSNGRVQASRTTAHR